jgi:y4mF family transcriptional regulator
MIILPGRKMPIQPLTIAGTVKRIRKQHGLNQEQLADIAGVSLPTITRLEGGKANIRLDMLVKILESLGCQLEIIAKEEAGGESSERGKE